MRVPSGVGTAAPRPARDFLIKAWKHVATKRDTFIQFNSFRSVFSSLKHQATLGENKQGEGVDPEGPMSLKRLGIYTMWESTVQL